MKIYCNEKAWIRWKAWVSVRFLIALDEIKSTEKRISLLSRMFQNAEVTEEKPFRIKVSFWNGGIAVINFAPHTYWVDDAKYEMWRVAVFDECWGSRMEEANRNLQRLHGGTDGA